MQIYDRESMRRFARVELGDDAVPDDTTFCAFAICWSGSTAHSSVVPMTDDSDDRPFTGKARIELVLADRRGDMGQAAAFASRHTHFR